MKIHLHFDEKVLLHFQRKEFKEQLKEIIIKDAIENEHNANKDLNQDFYGEIKDYEFHYTFISEEHVKVLDIYKKTKTEKTFKEITHEQIRNHFKDNFNANDVKYEDIRVITEYITQQEKQDNYTTNLIDIAQHRLEQISLLETKLSKKDELLELYRELHNKYRYPTWLYNEKVIIILEQIKELENDK